MPSLTHRRSSLVRAPTEIGKVRCGDPPKISSQRRTKRVGHRLRWSMSLSATGVVEFFGALMIDEREREALKVAV